jgi:hypothetical protein
MTVDMCLSVAAAYSYAGVEYGRECWYGNVLSSGAAQDTNLADCNTLCPGNALQYCGSGGHLVLYTSRTHPPSTPNPPTQPPFVGDAPYLGCVTEGTSARALAGPSFASDNMTLEACAAFCGSGMKYFGVEYARECEFATYHGLDILWEEELLTTFFWLQVTAETASAPDR